MFGANVLKEVVVVLVKEVRVDSEEDYFNILKNNLSILKNFSMNNNMKKVLSDFVVISKTLKSNSAGFYEEINVVLEVLWNGVN